MEPPTDSPKSHAGHCIDEYWTTKLTKWPTTATVCDSDQNTQTPLFISQPREDSDDDDLAQEHATAPVNSAVCVANQHANILPDNPARPSGSGAGQRDGLKRYARGDIELQLATLTQYSLNKKLQAIEWICCSCSKEQKFRSNLEPLDRLRCQYPRCGVSDKGFRIYRVHDMCDKCTVFVDQRAPVTRKGLKKKRDEVRAVLKKIKTVYEDVDRLIPFDNKETEYIASLIEKKAASEEFERERLEEEDRLRAEMERTQMGDSIGEAEDHSETESEYDEVSEHEDGERKKDEDRKVRRFGRKKRGFKSLLGF